MFNSNIIGNLGEIKTIEYLTKLGYFCYTAALGNGPVDVIAVKGNKILKIECKSSNSIKQTKTGSKCNIQLRSIRYNRNKINGKKFDGSKSDLCFIWVEPFENLYIFDSSFLNNKTGIAIRKETISVNTTKL